MTTQTSHHAGPRYVLDKLIAVALVVWLLFFGGFSTVKQLLTPSRLSQAGQIADTVRTGAGRVIAPQAAPATSPAAAPVIAPRLPAAQPAVAPAVQPGALPTAVITINAVPVAQGVVVPQSMPVEYANSGPIVPTPIPTIAYPTALPAAVAAYTISPDGLCVIAPRNGKQYQVCQTWKYKSDEAASVADYIRTGLLPGVEVQ